MKKLFVALSILLCIVSCQTSVKDIIKKAEESTFIIYTYDEFGSPAGSGSGFFIDANGIGITNYHVLDGAVKAIIKTTDEKEYTIDKVLMSDKDWDIVKFSIKSNGDIFHPLKFSKKKIETGDVVYNISSPLGLQKTVSNGIVSSLREMKRYGNVVQITAPISHGSSGSPILDDKGNVFAVATFMREGGQNLNFGVLIDKQKIDNSTKSDFAGTNNKFNAQMGFIIINIPADDDASLMLNAIEFGKLSTTLYFSYTHLNLAGGNDYRLWIALNKKERGFTIEDLDTKKEYYVMSSTLGVDITNGTQIKLASTIRFKVYFPVIKEDLKRININVDGKYSNRFQFKDIDLEKFRKKVDVNFENYTRDYAIAILREGNLENAQDLLMEAVENNPYDIIALNALGILSYIADNNADALNYFSEAIDKSPNDELAYLNRFSVYKYQGNYPAALIDITRAINIVPRLGNFGLRAKLYIDMQEWKSAKDDLDKLAADDYFKSDVTVYLNRLIVNSHLENWKEVCNDIYIAFNLTDDSEIEKQLQILWDKYGCRDR